MNSGIFDITENDWVEDFPHENGKYLNECSECLKSFTGHKRRAVCKKCHVSSLEARCKELEEDLNKALFFIPSSARASFFKTQQD